MTLVVALAAIVLAAIVAGAQRRAWRARRRAARREALLRALIADAPSEEQAGASAAEATRTRRWLAFPDPAWFSLREPTAPEPTGRRAGAGRAASSSNPIDRLALWLRSRRWARRGLTAAAVVLALAAVGVIGYPFFSNLYTNQLQHHLRQELTSPELRQAYLDHDVPIGDSLTRIEIPRISVDTVVVEGTTETALRAGAGHYVDTPLPCVTGNVGIAGHRTTYGRPFHDLNELSVGDTVTLVTPIGKCSYKVDKKPFSVLPTDVAVLDPTPGPTLTLTTCDPPGSAARRLIVQATLVSGEVPASGEHHRTKPPSTIPGHE